MNPFVLCFESGLVVKKGENLSVYVKGRPESMRYNYREYTDLPIMYTAYTKVYRSLHS